MNSEWQPIETAPKDGTRILLFQPAGDYPAFQAVGVWDREFWTDTNEFGDIETKGAWTDHSVGSWGYEEYKELQPTHWMTLPNPPPP